jgi:hypothetical protein
MPNLSPELKQAVNDVSTTNLRSEPLRIDLMTTSFVSERPPTLVKVKIG